MPELEILLKNVSIEFTITKHLIKCFKFEKQMIATYLKEPKDSEPTQILLIKTTKNHSKSTNQIQKSQTFQMSVNQTTKTIKIHQNTHL